MFLLIILYNSIISNIVLLIVVFFTYIMFHVSCSRTLVCKMLNFKHLSFLLRTFSEYRDIDRQSTFCVVFRFTIFK